MSVQATEPFYVGNYRHSLDAKSRVTIPAKWRFEGDELDSYLAWPHKAGHIVVYPPRKTAEVREKAARVPTSDRKAQQALRQLFGRGHLFGCDKQGRIKLPDPLTAHAGIDKELVLMGLSDHFQIFAPQTYDTFEEEDFDLDEALAAIGV